MMRNLLLVFFVCLFGSAFTQPKSPEKPAYVGVVDYAKGSFGGYNAPQKGDSVYVYTDYQKISFRVFSADPKDTDRTFWIDFKSLKLLKKKEYGNIVSPTKTIPTGNYDMKFSDAGKKNFTVHLISLNHYGDGNTADMNILGEHDGHRLDDICVARLLKVK